MGLRQERAGPTGKRTVQVPQSAIEAALSFRHQSPLMITEHNATVGHCAQVAADGNIFTVIETIGMERYHPTILAWALTEIRETVAAYQLQCDIQYGTIHGEDIPPFDMKEFHWVGRRCQHTRRNAVVMFAFNCAMLLWCLLLCASVCLQRSQSRLTPCT